MNTHLVPFHGETITAIETPEGIFVPISPLCARLSIARQPQQAKIKADPERWGCTIIMHPSAGGEQETLCIPVNRIAAWLFTLNANKVKPEAREALIAYQREAADVLDRHFRLRQHEQETELARLREQQARMRAFTLAFNPLWNKISRLQEAGIGRRQVWGMFGGRTRNYIDVTIEHMEGAGVIQPEDWDEGFMPPMPEGLTPIEGMQHEMALQFGEAGNA